MVRAPTSVPRPRQIFDAGTSKARLVSAGDHRRIEPHQGRRAMTEPIYVETHQAMCLRLAADCKELAARAPDLKQRVKFLRMACTWTEMAYPTRILH